MVWSELIQVHKKVQNEFRKFLRNNGGNLGKVCYLGSLNLNGTIEYMDKVGFDIIEGPGVDVVIAPGIIPMDHKLKYDTCVSISSFQFCPDPEIYMSEILDLLRNTAGSKLFLTLCHESCKTSHTTSDNRYSFKDEIRFSEEKLIDFFSSEFEIIVKKTSRSILSNHRDYVITGILK